MMWEIPNVSKHTFTQASAAILRAVSKYQFDGIVLECPVVPATTNFLIKLAGVMHRVKSGAKQLVLVVPPSLASSARGEQAADVARVAAAVHALSLMTYDYSVHQGRAGPNAPLRWSVDTAAALVALVTRALPKSVAAHVDASSTARKVLMGIPFYGSVHERAAAGHA
ncbi:hypothetical protein EON66_07285 [archaeon]|nr:MAG: hypothetical protein EON66_07285 [archaeon]